MKWIYIYFLRYISCTSCEKWYHLRCTNIGDVLPGLLSKDIKSSAVDFYCGLDGCNSDGSYCIYKKKNSNVKFQIKISTTDITTSKPVSPNNELNNTKEQDQDTVINIDEIRPNVLTSQKRTEKVNLKETILEENNVDLSDGHLDDHSDENLAQVSVRHCIKKQVLQKTH